jgi:fucose 4-O-acetylase-like acetyltransferase
LKDRVRLYDNLKVLAVILVLVGHSTYLAIGTTYGGVNYPAEFGLSRLYNLFLNLVGKIYLFHMPLFLFISGGLFYMSFSKGKFSFEMMISNKFKRLIIPYIAYGILYNIPIKLIANYYTIGNVPRAIVYDTFLGQNVVQHIWFLPTLFFITIIFYIIYCILMKENDKYALILLIILTIFSSQINITAPGIKNLVILLISFFIGAMFEKRRIKFEKILTNKKSYLFTIFFSIFSIIVFKLYTAESKIFLKNIYYIFMLISIFLTLTTFSYIIKDIKWLYKNKIYNLISNYSFDIYILSDPLNYVVLFLISTFGLSYIYSSNLGTLISIGIRTVGIAIISILFALLINKMKEYKLFNEFIKKTLIIVISISIIYCILIV